MKNKQYIFCLETTSGANTDWFYIRRVIDYKNKVIQSLDKYHPLYMEGKGNYNKKSFVTKLNKAIKEYDGESVVIYCIDLDDYHINNTTHKFVDDVENYCIDNGYKFVYFSRDIEEVFLGKRIEQKEKKRAAARFAKNGEITEDLSAKLTVETRAIKTSNILLILESL